MALNRRGSRFQASIWPGFVDAMTGLLLVLFFVLTIFMVMQSLLSQQITGQESELDKLGTELETLSDALGLERQKSAELDQTLTEAEATAAARATMLANLQNQSDAQAKDLQAAADREAALTQSLTQARSELDAQTEAARLAAAKREAVEALLDQVRADLATREATLAQTQTKLSDEEAGRLAEAAAAEALRAKLKDSDAELSAMTLSLEAARKQAEDTLTLLAAATAAKDDLTAELAARAQALSEADRQAALLKTAEEALAKAEAGRDETAAEAEKRARDLALANAQLAELRMQLGSLTGLLDAAQSKDQAASQEIGDLTQRLNTALARANVEERRRAELEEAERKRLESEAQRLERYQSEFFGRLRDAIGDQEGVKIVGDRFVFDSEVLFDVGQADLSEAGKAEIAKVARLLQEVAAVIPPGINWIVRVDGHTDDTPIRSTRFRDNWELSQARALSVVRYMIDEFGFPPYRLAATGFGQYQPIDPADTAEARAKNRRIELKLTER